MRIVKSLNNKMYLLKNKFNKLSKEWKMSICGSWTKTYNVYCLYTLKIQKRRLFGESFRIDYYSNGLWEVDILEEDDLGLISSPIKLIEKLIDEEIQINKC